MHVLQEGRVTTVDELGRHGRVRPDVCQEQAGSEMPILLLDVCKQNELVHSSTADAL